MSMPTSPRRNIDNIEAIKLIVSSIQFSKSCVKYAKTVNCDEQNIGHLMPPIYKKIYHSK